MIFHLLCCFVVFGEIIEGQNDNISICIEECKTDSQMKPTTTSEIKEENDVEFWREVSKIIKEIFGDYTQYFMKDGEDFKQTWERIEEFLNENWIINALKSIINTSVDFAGIFVDIKKIMKMGFKLMKEPDNKKRFQFQNEIIDSLRSLRDRTITIKEWKTYFSSITDNLNWSKEKMDELNKGLKEKASVFLNDGVKRLNDGVKKTEELTNKAFQWLKRKLNN